MSATFLLFLKLIPEKMRATAIAHSNLALVKYWGKRSKELNLPAVGSISVTLKDLFTKTTIAFKTELRQDILYLNGSNAADASPQKRVSRFLDEIRRRAGINAYAEVNSWNNFPTAAGLASSASGFAALAVAASRAANLGLNPTELSTLSRQASGSAARSIFGGFVEMQAGSRIDGSDAHAAPLTDEKFWPLRILVAITSGAEKQIGSTAAMKLSASSSPFYQNWLMTSHQDLVEMRSAILQRDLEKVGKIAEHNCLKMHALTMTSRPAVLYWNGTTVNIMLAVRQLRSQGLPVYFTIDAGAHVMAICAPGDSQKIKQILEQIAGVTRVLITSPGPAAHIVEN